MDPVFTHFDFFCLRVAQKPITYLSEKIDELLATSPTPDSYVLLEPILQLPWVKEALYLASPNLYTSWFSALESGKQPGQAVAQALWRYVFRLFSRSTPFGLFAGTAVGTLTTESVISFGPTPWQPYSRPDASVLIGIVHALDVQPLLRPYLTYRLNNSVYKAVDSFRYAEAVYDGDDTRIVLSSVESSPQLEGLLTKLSPTRFDTYDQLLKLAQGVELSSDIIDALIEAQVLTSNLQLAVTGRNLHESLLEQLIPLEHLEQVDQWTKQLQAALQRLNPALTLQNLFSAQHMLAQLAIQTNPGATAPKSLIQTDLYFKPAILSLDKSLVQSIAHQFNEVLPLIQSTINPPFQQFQSQFKERYGHQSVALLEVLDPEIGIGYNSDELAKYPLLTELAHVNKKSTLVSTLPADLDEFRKSLYKRYLLGKNHELRLTETDIDRLRERKAQLPLPPCWFVHGEMYRSKEKTIKAAEADPSSNWSFLVNPSIGNSPSSLLGRFCLGDPELSDQVHRMCVWEQAQFPNDILAEFVHLPTKSTSTGNLIIRPVLRPYEIPYLNPSSVNGPHTLLLADLYVSVGVDDQVILTHKPTGKRVRPRHSTAHNSLRGDEVYQFMAHLQQAESNVHFWSWGHFEQMPFLPRLVYKNLIIAPAQWTLDRIASSKGQSATIDDLRTLYKLPRYVLLIEGDNKLLLDLEFVPAQTILLDALHKRIVLLYEWLGDQLEQWVSEGNNRYESEFIIPFRTANSPVNSSKLPQLTAIRRTYFPGQEWFYVKVYCQELASDEVLLKAILPFWEQVQRQGWSSQLFFIRYTDPGYHLRIRLLCDPAKTDAIFKLLPGCLSPFLDSGLIERYQIDTYQRELERYNPDLITYSEAIFAADSQLMFQFLQQTEQPDELERYTLAMSSIDQLYADFGLSMELRGFLSTKLQQAFWQEHGSVKEVKRKLNDTYRSWEASLIEGMRDLAPLFHTRSGSIHNQVTYVQTYFESRPNPNALWDWLMHHNHMSLTRIFTGQNRQHEMVTYHFLARYYAATLAKQKLVFAK